MCKLHASEAAERVAHQGDGDQNADPRQARHGGGVVALADGEAFGEDADGEIQRHL